MKQVIGFLNKHNLTAGDVILTSIISTIATMIVIFLFKSYVLEWLKSAFSKPKAYVDKKLRWRKGKLTIGELIELQRKKEAGESLRADEERLLATHERKVIEILAKRRTLK